jgi:hypothetical protein
LRVEHGSGLSLRSALGIAHERGLPVGKAAEFHAAREAKHAASPAGQAAAADFRAKAATALNAAGERKAAMLAERQKRVAGTVRALGKGMLAQRKAVVAAKAEAARKVAAPKVRTTYIDLDDHRRRFPGARLDDRLRKQARDIARKAGATQVVFHRRGDKSNVIEHFSLSEPTAAEYFGGNERRAGAGGNTR